MDLKEFDRDESHRIPVDRKRDWVPSRGAGSFDAATEQIHRIGAERRRATALRIESVAGAAHDAAGDLEWSVLRYNPDLNAYELNATEDQLRNAPVLATGWETGVVSRGWERNIHDYYRASPYW